MHIADATSRESLEPRLELAMGAMNDTVKELSSALIARASGGPRSPAARRRVVAVAKSMKPRFLEMVAAASEPTPNGQQTIQELGANVTRWLCRTDEVHQLIEKQEAIHNALSREARRANAEFISGARQLYEILDELRDLMMDFMESIDPTPVGYLEDEIHRIHGAEGAAVLTGLIELSSSDTYTLEAFKQRHNLK
jgi:hypothetical protein